MILEERPNYESFIDSPRVCNEYSEGSQDRRSPGMDDKKRTEGKQIKRNRFRSAVTREKETLQRINRKRPLQQILAHGKQIYGKIRMV